MFILSKEESSLDSLQTFRSELKGIGTSFSPIEEFKIGAYFLYWFSAKPQDQLTVFKNGFILGKSSFEEDFKLGSRLEKEKAVPENLHTLLQSTKIEIDNEEVKITPNGITSIYYSENNNVSDHQLIIAKHEKLKPDNNLIQLLCGVGYFPGNLTLFKSIQRIPYLFSLELNKLKLFQVENFEPKLSDDEKMLERLIEVIPDNINVNLSMSGGMDSRFVLGLLLKKGIEPKLITMKSEDTGVVKELSDKLNLELEINKYQPIDEYLYTLMTDARIYFRGGNYSQMLNTIRPNELIYNGISILPINENSFASAWKKPGKLSTIYEDLIDYALIQRVPLRGFTKFKNPFTKSQMKSFLTKELSFGKDYFNFKTRKQWGTWFYHLHRGLTWSPAHLADLSFFIYPVFSLSDKKATEIGISSTAYQNFNKERLRRMNQRLFETVRVDYANDRKFESGSRLIIPLSKYYNEYFKKFFKRFKQLKKYPSQTNTDWFSEVSKLEATNFKHYFTEGFDELLNDNQASFNEKRIAVTLNHVLLFLNK
jgi:hypothetical protein